jgi:hypothetical protein
LHETYGAFSMNPTRRPARLPGGSFDGRMATSASCRVRPREAQECIVDDELQADRRMRGAVLREQRHEQAVHQRIGARHPQYALIDPLEMRLCTLDLLGDAGGGRAVPRRQLSADSRIAGA